MITIKNLKKSFGNSLIFQNVNLDIEKGDAVVIIGGSGCGKSTFLRCINRLEQADEGQILINGKQGRQNAFSAFRRTKAKGCHRQSHDDETGSNAV